MAVTLFMNSYFWQPHLLQVYILSMQTAEENSSCVLQWGPVDAQTFYQLLPVRTQQNTSVRVLFRPLASSGASAGSPRWGPWALHAQALGSPWNLGASSALTSHKGIVSLCVSPPTTVQWVPKPPEDWSLLICLCPCTEILFPWKRTESSLATKASGRGLCVKT